MMDARNFLTGIVVGAVTALLVREVMQYGLAIERWSLAVPRGGEALLAGGLVGAISQLVGRLGARR